MKTKQPTEIIVAFGHENIQATHPTTIMITKDNHLTKAGDCIVAVSANKAPTDFDPAFKNKLKTNNSKLTITIETDDIKETIHAFGSPNLILTNSKDVVIRKSDFLSDRTVAIRADKASNNLPQELVKKCQNPKQRITITLTVV